MPALTTLRTRLAELADLDALGGLASWDQETMMPPDGASARGHQLASLSRLAHERAVADEVGEWLDDIEADAAALSDLDRDIVRLARRDWDRQRRVPSELVGERAQAASEGQTAWQAARAASDFEAFVPALRRNVELARDYAGCFDDVERPYDALLNDYDFGVPAQRLEPVFARLTEGLTALLAELSAAPADLSASLEVPIDAQKAAVLSTLRRIGVGDDSWRVDVSRHPFSESLSRRDTRVTTRYEDGSLESVVAALHEFGHALYERQIAPELERTNLGCGTSMSVHESQSKLWENHVGRNRAFTPVLAAELAAGGFSIEAEALHAALVQVRPSLIRVSADQVTYPLHIALRFELELALFEKSLDIGDLPAAWNDGMRRLLGLEVPDAASGVLQDIHWAAGAFGYFPSYGIGCLIAAQLWEQLEADLGTQDTALSVGDIAAIRDWLGERVHRYGRRLDTEPLVEQATGRGIEVEPFLRHVTPLVGA
jgi:carboxypeptidase Taq